MIASDITKSIYLSKFQVITVSNIEVMSKLIYDWREFGLLIGPIYLHKSLCLPENWSKLAYMFDIG